MALSCLNYKYIISSRLPLVELWPSIAGDAHHVTQPPPDGDGGYRCMALAAKNAKLRPRDIQVVSCHATSTPQGDRAELNAVTRFFGYCLACSRSSRRTSPVAVL